MSSEISPLAQHSTACEAVRDLDLRRVEQRMLKQYPTWTEERVRIAIEEYRRFLFLAMIHPDVPLIPPTPDLDEVWHAHILHTIQYADDCAELFGEFFHHEPGEGVMPMDLYQQTLEL